MATENSKRDRYEAAMLALVGMTAVIVIALNTFACLRHGLGVEDYVGIAFWLVPILLPFFILDWMICANGRSLLQKRVILIGGLGMSLPAWWAYYMTYTYPDAQGGLVFFVVPVVQLIGCGILAGGATCFRNNTHGS
jgi:hypothetical protein